MKAYAAALAALLLAVPAESFARGRVYVTNRPSFVSRVTVPRIVPRVVVPRVRYAQPYYYGPSYYAPSYYGSGYYSGFGTSYYSGYAPSVSFSYSSAPAYRPAPAAQYDSGSSLEADVQRELRRRGFYDGAIDGDIGPASRGAIRDYQSAHGLSPTGRIDAALLRALGM